MGSLDTSDQQFEKGTSEMFPGLGLGAVAASTQDSTSAAASQQAMGREHVLTTSEAVPGSTAAAHAARRAARSAH